VFICAFSNYFSPNGKIALLSWICCYFFPFISVASIHRNTLLSYCGLFCSCWQYFYTNILDCSILCCLLYMSDPHICCLLYASISMILHVLLFQIITTFSVVDNMKQQFYAQQGNISRFCIFFLTNYVGFLCYMK